MIVQNRSFTLAFFLLRYYKTQRYGAWVTMFLCVPCICNRHRNIGSVIVTWTGARIGNLGVPVARVFTRT